MLMRCATRLAAGPALLAGGLLIATGVAAALTAAGAATGAVLLARRFREERQGWRESGGDPLPETSDLPTS